MILLAFTLDFVRVDDFFITWLELLQHAVAYVIPLSLKNPQTKIYQNWLCGFHIAQRYIRIYNISQYKQVPA